MALIYLFQSSTQFIERGFAAVGEARTGGWRIRKEPTQPDILIRQEAAGFSHHDGQSSSLESRVRWLLRRAKKRVQSPGADVLGRRSAAPARCHA